MIGSHNQQQQGSNPTFIVLMLIVGMWMLWYSWRNPPPTKDTGANQPANTVNGPAPSTAGNQPETNSPPSSANVAIDENPSLEGTTLARQSEILDAYLASDQTQIDAGGLPEGVSIAKNEVLLLVDTPKYFIEFTAVGASVRKLLLREYYDSAENQKENDYEIPVKDREQACVLLGAYQKPYSLALNITRPNNWPEGANLGEDYWELANPSKPFTVGADGQIVIEYFYDLPHSLRMIKRFSIEKNDYRIRLEVEVKSLSAEVSAPQRTLGIEIAAFSGLHNEDVVRSIFGGVYFSNVQGGRIDIAAQEVHAEPEKVDYRPAVMSGSQQDVVWAGLMSRYFFALLRPVNPESGNFRYKPLSITSEIPEYTKNLITSYETSMDMPMPGSKTSIQMDVLAGPKLDEVLQKHSLTPLKEYLWSGLVVTRWLSDFFLFSLTGLEGIVGNFGLAIILLTILVRIAMLPLSIYQTKNMILYSEKMKVIQPKIKELNDKHKDDARKRGEEMMRLYREENFSPLPKGCWTMLLQMPIFIGMIAIFYNAVELRHSGFIFWINDLAKPDSLYLFKGVNLWFLSTPEGFNLSLLPVIYMALMWTLQKTQPKQTPQPGQPDPTKMMGCMMIVFGLFFYAFQSGPMLYFCTTLGWSLTETLTIKKRIREKMQGAKA
ncbi:MAG: membrane protein insertase YidC [Planctomycetes bacterium]|nr:membrane protein insertase YidC [Planctomycetota bacterium]